MHHSYQTGSRGFVIRRLQTALGVAADGVFGPQTTAAVARLQSQHNAVADAPDLAIPLAASGQAGPAEFALAGLSWPCEFERAMNLVSGFEGTCFGDCNFRDIDGAGLTLGIAGFTTGHGEVQELIARLVSCQPDCISVLPGAVQSRLMEFLSHRHTSAAHWRRLMFRGDGSVFPHWREAFSRWGDSPFMQSIQLDMARSRFWQPGVSVAESLGFTSLRARLFYLDVAVQNGGWRRSHLVLAKRMVDWHSDDERRALTVAARAVAACAREQWRNDVLSRKMAIATGTGMVHGRIWDLEKFAV